VWLPPESTSDAGVLLSARGVRAFAGGFVSVLLPAYLLTLGFNAFQIGPVATATLAGSAALTLLVGLIAHRFRSRQLLTSAAVLMVAKGVAFVFVHEYWPLLVVALLLARYALSQMDVPPRNSYVMAVVPPAERPAAASITAVPRTVAAAISPLASGYLLGVSTLGWPLVAAGVVKAIYDVLLLAMFAKVRPPDEAEVAR